jgi:hypothetical protein
MIEKWLQIPNTKYSVSSYGNVKRNELYRSSNKDGCVKPSIGNRGYLLVSLSTNNIKNTKSVHVLVATLFLGTKPAGLEINHIDGNKLNNNIENLEYVTKSQNQKHAIKLGLVDIDRLRNTKKLCGDDHWTHKKPESIAVGDRHGSHTHPEKWKRGSESNLSKLNEYQVKQIREQYIMGASIKEISQKYNMYYQSIWGIVNNKSWRHCL